jgi:hypothetical protein
MGLEVAQPLLDGGQAAKVVQREDLAWHDREVGLDLGELARGVGVGTSVAGGHRARRRSTVGSPRWPELWSTIQKTRRVEWEGSCRLTWATRRSNGAILGWGSPRPNPLARGPSQAAR